MIGIIIIILILLHIIYLNTKHIEKFGGMAQCKSLKNHGSDFDGIMNKVKGCIKDIGDQLKAATDKIENINDTISPLIEDKLKDKIPIKIVNDLTYILKNPKETIIIPFSIFIWKISGIVTSKAAEQVAKLDDEQATK